MENACYTQSALIEGNATLWLKVTENSSNIIPKSVFKANVLVNRENEKFL